MFQFLGHPVTISQQNTVSVMQKFAAVKLTCNYITNMSKGLSCRTGALFTTVSSIRVSRVSRVRVTLTVTVRVSRVSVMVSVRDSVK